MNINLKNIFLVIFVVSFVQNCCATWLDYAVKFATDRRLHSASALLCNQNDLKKFFEIFSNAGKKTNGIMLNDFNAYAFSKTIAFSHPRVAIILDTSCEHLQLLEWVSQNRGFDIRRHWLVYLNTSYSASDLEEASDWFEPDLFDVQGYLDEGVSDMTEKVKVKHFNSELNRELLLEISQRNNAKPNGVFSHPQLKPYMNLTALMDSEVTLAVPTESTTKSPTVEYNLFGIHRFAPTAKMRITHTGKMANERITWNYNPEYNANIRRRDLNGTVLRAASAIQRFDYFTRSGELTTKIYDTWAQGGLQLTVLIEQQLNFRALVKVFDLYGWLIDGKYNGMVACMAERCADICSSGILLTTVRMGAVDYVDNVVVEDIGIVFKQPPLAQVTNIFILPFSTDVWLTGLGLILGVSAFMFLQLKTLIGESEKIRVADIVTFFTASACQQGLNLGSSSISVRFTMLVFDLASLFLFTSYSAKIVTLLQSAGNRIKTIPDITESNLAVAVEDLPYQRKMFEEETSPLIQKLCEKKLNPNHVNPFANVTEAVQRVRKELFAFHGELSPIYKEVTETFTETEKCGLTTIHAFPKMYSGPALSKNSPYHETLKGSYLWLRETGLTSRTFRRWVYEPPQCAGGDVGFNSVGLTEMRPVFLFMVYGILIAAGLYLLELTISNFRQTPRKKNDNIFVKRKFSSSSYLQ